MAYDLERVTAEFREICRKAGAQSGLNVPIRLNGRLTRTLGRVTQQYDDLEGCYVSTLIEFSKQLLETSSDKSIHDVIMHEAAHLIVTDRTGESRGHDAVFKAVCAEISTTNDKPATKVERTVSDTQIYKYSVYCPTCGKNIDGYTRMCKTLRNIGQYKCKNCGKGNLQVITNW